MLGPASLPARQLPVQTATHVDLVATGSASSSNVSLVTQIGTANSPRQNLGQRQLAAATAATAPIVGQKKMTETATQLQESEI